MIPKVYTELSPIQAEPASILDDMRQVLELYGVVTVEDYYDLIGRKTSYTDRRFGWTNLDGAYVDSDPHAYGYRLRLPDPIELEVSIKSVPERPTQTNDTVPETVNHPSHYQSETGLEVIDVIEAFTFDLKGIMAFDTANVIKYICRWPKKNGLEDLKKAKFYIEHLIAHIEKLEKEN